MDDYLQSFHSITEAQQTVKAVDHVHKQAGCVRSGGTPNEEKTIEEITTEHKQNDATVRLGGKETEKTLGLLWHVQSDHIGFNTNNMKMPIDVKEKQRLPTKREMLSIIMALFDPLGLISPVTTPAKRIFQDTWRYKAEWDDPLPIELKEKWEDWITLLHALEQLRIPRCYD
ncbi:unnamed protein product [Parnassius apollo]|uniref:(apollo) hypothetical protein n=1 Tax=Parnassius apollo TaxID=110799 RepID=A0A8S3WMQ3_PARAO|nr:unnamed protein product [Parnassius apollo]